MTKRVKLTKQDQIDIKHRYTLSQRCLEWLDNNGQVEIAKRFGTTQFTVSKILHGKGSRILSDEQVKEVRRLAKHSNHVRDIQLRNSVRALRKEYGITAERIYNIARSKGGYRKRKKVRMNCVHDFLTRKLTSAPVHGYYR